MRYFDTPLLEVNIDCCHPTKVEDFFLVLFTFFWYFEPLSWYLLFHGYGFWWLLHWLPLVYLLLGEPLPSGLSLFLGFYSENLVLFSQGPNSLLSATLIATTVRSRCFLPPLLSNTVQSFSASSFSSSGSRDPLASKAYFLMETWLTGALIKSSGRDMLPLSIKSWILPFRTKQSSLE